MEGRELVKSIVSEVGCKTFSGRDLGAEEWVR